MARKKKTKEQIKQEIKSKLLDTELIERLILNYRNTLKPDIDRLARARAKMFKESLKQLIKSNTELYKNEKTLFTRKAGSIKFWREFFTAKLEICDALLLSFKQGEKLADNERYRQAVDFITSDDAPDFYKESQHPTEKTATAKEIVRVNDGSILFADELLDILLIKCISESEQISTKDAVDVLQAGKGLLANGDKGEIQIYAETGDLIKLEHKKVVDISDRLKPYVYAARDIKNNVYILIDQQEQLNDQQAEEVADGKELKLKDGVFITEDKEEVNKELYDILPTKILGYPDTFWIADTEIVNALITANYNADLNVFKKSDETLNSLSHQDREILDYIVLTLYPEQNYFSDYQIATGLYKERAGETVSDSMLKEINDSIDRIRNVRIDEGFISAEKINDLKAEVKINDHLITLRRIDVKHENKTTWYRIIGDPFYRDYAIRTKKVNHYEKQLITRTIEDEHIQNNIKNDTLKMFLTRSVFSLKYYKQIVINMLEVYDILGIKDPRKYTDARNKTKVMLEDILKDYDFKYSFKKKGRSTTRLIIEKYTDRPLEKQKNYS